MLLFAGAAPIAAALTGFRAADTRAEPWQPSSALVDGGIYGHTRNPMYVGMAVAGTGLGVALGRATGIAGAAFGAVMIDRLVIPREELYLRRRFGADYDHYRQRVPRWL